MREVFPQIFRQRGVGVLIILTFLLVYTTIKDYGSNLLHGGFRYSFSEAIVCLVLYMLFRSIQKPNIRAKLFSLIPIFSYYGLYEFNFLQFGSVLKFSDFLIIPELLDVLVFYEAILFVVLISTPIILIISNIRRQWKWPHILPSTFFISFLTLFGVIPVSMGERINNLLPFQEFSQEHVVSFYGPISSALMFEFQRRHNFQKITEFPSQNTEINSEHFRLPVGVSPNKNIHILVLEGFVDVRKFTALNLSNEFNRWLGDSVMKSAGISVAPGFGNGTARSEFEILCGLPSMQLFGSIEFTIFDGENEIDCLPKIFSDAGYITVASHPYKPNYYNRLKAYKTIGFSDMKFGDRYTKIQGGIKTDDAPAGWLFDGSLYKQNIEMVKDLLAKGQPIFNYVLTAYGHYPFERDENKRPDMTSIESVPDEVNRLVNQMYYRVKALDHYVKALKDIDPDALIVIVGDHLPPLTNGRKKYDRLGYLSSEAKIYSTYGSADKYHQTVVKVIDAQSSVKLPSIHHYDLFQIVIDRVFSGDFCQLNKCGFNGERKNKNFSSEYAGLMKKSLTPIIK